MEENQTQEQDEKTKAIREAVIKDFVSLVRTFCGEEMRRNNYLPPEQATYRGNFITTFESDLINQTKNLLK